MQNTVFHEVNHMTCRQVESLIPDFISGDLAGDELEEVRTHIEGCSECAKAAELFKSTIFLIKESAYSPPEEIVSNVKNRINAYNKRQRIFRLAMRYTAVAAVAAIILSVTLSRLPKLGMKSDMSVIPKNSQSAGEMSAEDIKIEGGISEDSVITEANQIAPRAAMMTPSQLISPEPEEAAEDQTMAETEEVLGVMTYGLLPAQEDAVDKAADEVPETPVAEYSLPEDNSEEIYYASGDFKAFSLAAPPAPKLVAPNLDGAEYLINNYAPEFEGRVYEIYTTGSGIGDDPVLMRKFNKMENEDYNLYFAKNTIDVADTVCFASGGGYRMNGFESTARTDGSMYIIILEFFKTE
jgi:hypothetical protein